MNLENMLVKTEQPEKDLLICEFDNGFAVAYSKDDGVQDHNICYAITPDHPTRMRAEPWLVDTYSYSGHEFGYKYGSSISAPRSIAVYDYRSKNGARVKQLEDRLFELYHEVVDELNLEEYTKQESLGDIFSSFYSIFEVIVSLISPRKWTQKRVGNKEIITKKGDGKIPAIDFRGCPENVEGIELLFPDGTSIHPNFSPDKQEWAHKYFTHNYFDYSSDGRYDEMNYFVNANPELVDEMNKICEERKTIFRAREEFEKYLRENEDEQKALLKQLGFMED